MEDAFEDYRDELDHLLLEGFDDGMLLSELDGFFAGLILSPDTVPPERWLKRVWGGHSTPPFDDVALMERFIQLLLRHYEEVRLSLEVPGGYEPLFDVDERHDETLWEVWIEGFSAAMRLAPAGWNRLRRSFDPGANKALADLVELGDFAAGHLDISREEEAERHREAPALIALSVQVLYDWRIAAGVTLSAAKVGRNDPCPCGSGKKFKKCCGAG